MSFKDTVCSSSLSVSGGSPGPCSISVSPGLAALLASAVTDHTSSTRVSCVKADSRSIVKTGGKAGVIGLVDLL